MNDAEIVVSLRMIATSNVAAQLKADALVLEETQAKLASVGVASNKTALAERDVATASKAAAVNMGEMGAASRIASGNLDALGASALVTKGNFALLGAAAAGYALYEGAKFQASLVETRNNTTMTTAQFGQMRAEILRLGAESPISLDALAAGYRQISDTGYQGAAANKLMQVSMESAASTGADFATVATTLASVMHSMGANANEAGHFMDVLHLAANEGRLTLQDMASVFGVVSTYASEAGISVEDAAAAIATMTRNGLDAATAATQFKDSVIHIINPGKQARDEIALLSKQTGVDLVHDFTQAGLSAKGLFGVMGDVKTATNGNVQEMARLIPNMRGLLAEMILTGKGAKDYATILGQLKDAHGQTEEAFKRSQKTLDFWFGTLHNKIIIAAADIGTIMIPAIQALGDEAAKDLKPVTFEIKVAMDFGKATGLSSLPGADQAPKAMAVSWDILHAALVRVNDDINPVARGINMTTGIMQDGTDAIHGAKNAWGGLTGETARAAIEQERELKMLVENTRQLDAQTGALQRLTVAKHDAFQPVQSPYQFGPGARPGYGPGGDTTMYSTFPGVRALDETSKKAAASVSLHSAKVDALTAAQNKLQEAENAAYADLAAGHPITVAHREAIKADAEKVKDMTDAVNNIITPAKALAQTFNTVAGQISTAIGAAADAIGKSLVRAGIVRTPTGYGNQYLDTSIPYGVIAGQQAEPPGGYVPGPVKNPTGYGYDTTIPAAVAAGLAAEDAANAAYQAALAYKLANPGGNRGGIVGPDGQLVTPEGTGVSSVQTGQNYPALFAGIQAAISQQSSEMSTASSLQSARLQVIASLGQLQIDGIQSVVTATQDQTQIIQAQTSVDAAASAALVSHITGQTGILQAMGAGQVQSIKDQGAIAADIKSGDTAKLAQDRQIAAIDERLSSENLAIARERALIDDQSAANQLQAAQDNLKLAQDKARVDAADAVAKQQVDQATLGVNQAQYQLLVTQTNLQSDMVQLLGALAQVPLPANILADMNSVGGAGQGLLGAQGALSAAMLNAGLVNGQGQGLLANDSLQAALNASGGQQSLASLQAVLQGMLQTQQLTQNQRDAYDAMLSVLNAIQTSSSQTASNTSQTATNTATIAAQNEEIQTLKERLRNAQNPGTNRQIVIAPALPGAWHPVNSRPQL